MSDAWRSVCAVVVTHDPDVPLLTAAAEAVAAQSGRVVIVDNGSSPEKAAAIAGLAARIGAATVLSPANRGVGWGHNAGIAWAREQSMRYVLLLDQDSTAAPGMVEALCAAYEALARERPVAAVGPRAVDARDGAAAPFVRLGFPLNRKCRCRGEGETIRADFLITSGTLIPLDVLDAVGAMNEALFIDNVDLEWCFRARARGYGLYGVCRARLLHRLGDRRLPLGGIAIHAPLRLYYMMRNRVLLYRMPHTPRVWILQDVIRLPIKTFIFAVLVAPRLKNLYFIAKGVWHGLAGRAGAYS